MSRSRCSSASRMLDNILLQKVVQKARSMSQWPYPEVRRKRLPEIGKRLSRADINPCADAGAGQQNRYVLARVVGTGRRRIVSVIRCHHQQVGWPQGGQNPGEPFIEALEIGGVTEHV